MPSSSSQSTAATTPNSHKPTELFRLKQSGIVPKKHIINDKVSEAMKIVIRDEYTMKMELIPPGCHQSNAVEVAIRNFKAHFLSVLSGVADHFLLHFWDHFLP